MCAWEGEELICNYSLIGTPLAFSPNVNALLITACLASAGNVIGPVKPSIRSEYVVRHIQEAEKSESFSETRAKQVDWPGRLLRIR